MENLISRRLCKTDGRKGSVHLELELSSNLSIKLYEWIDEPVLSEKYCDDEDFSHVFKINRFGLDPSSLASAIETVSRWQMRADYNCLSDVIFFLAFPTADEALLAKLSLH